MLNGIACIFDSEPDDPPKNPRDYSWTVDTLSYPGSRLTDMRSIWGSSPEDVYAAGWNWESYGQMYHYDGNEWTDVKLSTDLGGNIEPVIDLSNVYGFSANNIWAVGVDYPSDSPDSSRLVLHFNGTEWQHVDMPSGGWLFSIGGSGPNDLWVGGAYATLLHYDGSSWERHSVPLPVSYTSGLFAHFPSFAGNAANDIHAIISNATYWSYHLGYDGTEWTVKDSFYVFDREKLWMSPSGTLYSIGNRMVSRWKTGSWETLLEGDFLFGGISGAEDDNIFIVGYRLGLEPGEGNTTVFLYDGIDWYEYPNFNQYKAFLKSVWTDGREVFISGKLGSKTIIFHGR